VARHYLEVTTVATGVAQDLAILQIWNPAGQPRASLRRFDVIHVSATAPSGYMGFRLFRSTARGTPGSTVTPTAAMAIDGQVAIGVLLDIQVFTVEPTKSAGALFPGWTIANRRAFGLIMPRHEPIDIPANSGLVFANFNAGGNVTACPSVEFGLHMET
jgi:hypothetical protein